MWFTDTRFLEKPKNRNHLVRDMKPTKDSVTVIVNDQPIIMYYDKLYRVGVFNHPNKKRIKEYIMPHETFYNQTMMDIKRISRNDDMTIDYVVEM